MNEKKPFKPGERKPSPKPREPKPILEHGDFEKRDNPQNDRYKPSFIRNLEMINDNRKREEIPRNANRNKR